MGRSHGGLYETCYKDGGDMVEWLKKNWSIVTTIMWYGKKIDANTTTTKNNTESTTAVVSAVTSITQWMKDHDVRHEDHKALHEAER